MTMYEEGYNYYVAQCEQYGMQPLSLRYFVKQLTEEQLKAYNEYAKQTGERYE